MRKMKATTTSLLASLGLAVLPGALSSQAATVWNGPLITYNQPAPIPSDPANQDILTPHVSITRGDPSGPESGSGGIFNGITETSFTKYVSPDDTEWAVGELSNYASLTYMDWTDAGGGHPVLNLVGEQLVVHLISDNIYLSLKFTYLPSGPGFTYIRSTPMSSNVPPAVSIISPTNGASFTAPAMVAITANATDSDGNVTNVLFFDGSTLLGGTNNLPYSVTATLTTGAHALTAVATDNGGLSTTSSVVNVTVSAGHSPPSVTITNPPDNSVFGNTDSIGINTSVSDAGATVTNVQLFDGLTLLHSFSTAPYNFTAGAFTFALGVHTLTAVAADNLGAAATSAPVHLTIARYTPEVTNGALSLFLVPVATNLSAPLYGVSPPGDTHRLFVLEQNGLMRIIQDGVLLPTPALDLQSLVSPPLVPSNANDERGLLGLAFHPGFNNPASPGYHTLYTYNSEMIPSNTLPTYPLSGGTSNLYKNALNEWKISSTNANIVDPSTRREIISFGKNAQNHNGGTCTFGPDGYMYLALGDGGNANDVGPGHISPGGNAQNLSVPLGKMLRINPLNPSLNTNSPDPISTNGQYRIPTTNPFQGAGQVPEIYAYGFRNPYRFAFDPLTGDLIEADVGQNNIEEINRITNGGNYGWAIKEGDFLFNMTNGTVGTPPGHFSPGSPAGLTDPISGPGGILEYDHNNGISITGGFVYRGSGMPELYGKYIFGDLALIPAPVRINGRIFYADLQQGTMHVFTLPQFGSEILPNDQTVHGFGQDANGEVYAMATDTPPNGNGGVVYKLFSVRLTARELGNTLDLSWPVAGGRLQRKTNSLAAAWQDVPNSTTTNHVIVPISPGSAYYRLAIP